MADTSQHLGPHERLMLLKALWPSGHQPVDALGALAEQAAERRFEAGATVIAPDGPWDRIHIVVEGQAGVYESDRELYTVGPRAAFGLLETMARVRGGVEARALVDTATVEIQAATFFSILEDHHVMTLALMQGLGRTLLSTPASLARSVTSRVPLSTMASGDCLDVVDRLGLLRASDLFARTRTYSLGEIASRFKDLRAHPGTVLWREGDPAPWLVLLLDGRVDSRSRSGLSFSSSTGTVPGVFEALAAAPRWHDATAATAVTGLRLDVDDFFEALEDDFSMAEDLLAALAARVRDVRYGLATPTGAFSPA